MPTLLSPALLLLIQISYSSYIDEWKAYNTLPTGISGAMTFHNSSTNDIFILSPMEPYGKSFLQFNTDSEKFIDLKYPESGKVKIEYSVTNDFVQIGDYLYFVDIFPWDDLNEFSLITQQFTSLNYSLPDDYSDNPCVTKSNDNKYIFILGGTNNDNVPLFYDTFYIYDVENKIIKGIGPKLPFRAATFGCIVDSNNTLYVIGGQYMDNNTLTYSSKQIWALPNVDNINKLINNNNFTKWIISNLSLSYAPKYPFVTQIENEIYIIGGWDNINKTCSNQVNILFNNMSLIISGPSLPKQSSLCYPAGIAVNYEIYLFGGQTFEDGHSNIKKPLTWIKSNYIGPPTPEPTLPTQSPTHSPTHSPTQSPTKSPTMSPTHSPTQSPTRSPTKSPTDSPTKSPTQSPTHSPTKSPTDSPTLPTLSPTRSPTQSPTQSPTMSPTASPTQSPTQHGSASKTNSDTTEYLEIFIPIAVVLLLCCCIAVIYCRKRRKNNKTEQLMFANDRDD